MQGAAPLPAPTAQRPTRAARVRSRHPLTPSQAGHLVADNLNWIEDDFKNIEELMARRGTPTTVLRDSAASEAAKAVAPPLDADDDAPDAEAAVPKIDGISDEQAMRIREAVRANKRRQRPPAGGGFG